MPIAQHGQCGRTVGETSTAREALIQYVADDAHTVTHYRTTRARSTSCTGSPRRRATGPLPGRARAADRFLKEYSYFHLGSVRKTNQSGSRRRGQDFGSPSGRPLTRCSRQTLPRQSAAAHRQDLSPDRVRSREQHFYAQEYSKAIGRTITFRTSVARGGTVLERACRVTCEPTRDDGRYAREEATTGRSDDAVTR